MKIKDSYFFTLREDVKDEDSVSGNLLVKAGFIKKTSAGVYMMLPLGLRVEQKIEEIVRRHMNETGAQEVRMPGLILQDYYEKSGRLANFGPSLFRLEDRTGKKFALGPTHEELFVLAAKSMIRSYKNLPFSLHQFQTKFRDEPRARFGLIRVKEFVMQDGYSFDADEAGMDVNYNKFFEAYKRSFDEIGINYRIVKADTGVMGGLLSEEFQAITPIGEDTVVYCDDCGFTSNLEIAECKHIDVPTTLELRQKELVHTPNAGTIEDVCKYLDQPSNKFIKTLIYLCDGKPYGVLVAGNQEVSETKIQKILKCNEIALADAKTVMDVTNAKVGFAGPIDLKCPIILDLEASHMHNFIVGANQTDYHYINVNVTDFKADYIADVRQVKEGDLCPCCGKPLKFTKGIEVGNTFKLGTKYSQALDLTYLNKENKNDYVWMGCYGIGIGRCMAAIVEQNHDDKGIIWPENIAPFQVAIVNISSKDENQVRIANELHDALSAKGIDVLLDNRDERPGVKFNDMELIGIPHRITVGKKAAEGIVEVKHRNSDEILELSIEEVINHFSK